MVFELSHLLNSRCSGNDCVMPMFRAAAMINWYETIEAGEPAAAIVIEFAPVPAGPPMRQVEISRLLDL